MYDDALMVILFGMVVGIITVLIKSVYDNYKMKNEIKEQNSKMVRMYNQGHGYIRIAKTEQKQIEEMIEKYGWEIVEEE
jgi:hypothetical protein